MNHTLTCGPDNKVVLLDYGTHHRTTATGVGFRVNSTHKGSHASSAYLATDSSATDLMTFEDEESYSGESTTYTNDEDKLENIPVPRRVFDPNRKKKNKAARKSRKKNRPRGRK